MKLRRPVPNFYIHVSVIYLYIPTIGLSILLYCVFGPILKIYKSRTECRNWEQDRAVSFLRIFLLRIFGTVHLQLWSSFSLWCGSRSGFLKWCGTMRISISNTDNDTFNTGTECLPHFAGCFYLWFPIFFYFLKKTFGSISLTNWPLMGQSASMLSFNAHSSCSPLAGIKVKVYIPDLWFYLKTMPTAVNIWRETALKGGGRRWESHPAL